jgi:protein SCO1/2
MRRWLLTLLFISVTTAAWAHSLKDLETLLGDKEKYFQSLDKAAPDFALETPDGKPVRLSDLRGRVVVLHFVYAGCPDICPLHADRIAEIQSMVNRTSVKAQVQFVTITTDPKSDTPDVLRAYGEQHRLDPANWAFLTTGSRQPEDTTRKLAEQFGHKFMKQEDGYQVHGIVTHVIDKEGRWRANFHGLRFEPSNLVVSINALVNDAQRAHGHERQSTWGRIKKRLGF